MNKISIQEVKEALKDHKFKQNLPDILREDIAKYEKNPGCPCNLSIYRNILKFASKQLSEYYPSREVVNPDLELPPLQENNWKVINCEASKLEEELKALGYGRIQLAVARWEDQVTVIVNFLDVDNTM
jgi:hypothetical protein